VIAQAALHHAINNVLAWLGLKAMALAWPWMALAWPGLALAQAAAFDSKNIMLAGENEMEHREP
jgi:hypothetical protein